MFLLSKPLRKAEFARIPSSIWALGFVSMLMDISSELVHSLLPLFMISVLHVSMTGVGVVEGIAEAVALIVKVFSGPLSDFLRKRKLLTLIGYSMSAFTKPLFPLASTLSMVFIARFLDRIGKGIRGAPRDALISDIAPKEIRGACFGLRQSLDKTGAFIGPILAMIGMYLWAEDIRMVLWFAVIPAILCVGLLWVGVEEPELSSKLNGKAKIHWSEIFSIGKAFWHLIVIAGFITLARFSEAFLVLKGADAGLTLTQAPIIMVVMSVVYSVAAYPAGILSDKISRQTLLIFAMIFLIIGDLLLAVNHHLIVTFLGVIFWGLHMAFSQGILATMVTDTTPSELRGTAYGVYNLVCGVSLLFASIIAGIVWDSYGSSATFLTGAALSLISLLGLAWLRYSPKY